MISFGTIAAVSAMICFTIAGNLVLKVGAAVPHAERVIFGLLGWQSLVGLGLFGVSGIIYSFVLRWLPLNVALAFTAAQYVGVAVAAAIILQEPISPLRWVGLACISIGIFIVGFTAHA